MLRHVSLFAGVDAIGIAAEQLGYETVAAVDNDPFCRSVLRARRPNAEILSDVREVGAHNLGTDIDLLSGGFPCQDLSTAGKGAGLSGQRSGLWFEFLRIISETRPKAVLIENVAVLKSRGLDVVLEGLASIGYGAWWDVVPALAVGAPHLRERIWITAVPVESMPTLASMPPALGLWTERPKMPRSGYMLHGFVDGLEPQATQAACKAAMGAVKDNGTTWLTAIDSPLYPTPSASTYGSNRGGAAGRTGPLRHSLTSMARSGMWPTPTSSMWKGASPLDRRPPCDDDLPTRVARVWPTPEKSDGTGGRVSAELGGVRPSGAKRAITLASAVNHEARLWPTPRASANEYRTTRSAPSHGKTHGQVLAGVVLDDERANGRVVAAPSQGSGSLNPDWVEWLMGLPIGWTDPSCAETIQRDWLSEYGIPRTATGVELRKQRLMACGNALVWKVALTRLMDLHARR